MLRIDKSTRRTQTWNPSSASRCMSLRSGQVLMTLSLLVLLIQIPAGGADDAQPLVIHQLHRHAFQVSACASLVQEAIHEAARQQHVAHGGQEPAHEIHPAAGAV